MSSSKRPILYVTRDIERGLGTEPCADYMVVANRTAYAETVKERYPRSVHLIDSLSGSLDTASLLKQDPVRKLIADTQADVLVFKNNVQIEAVAKENGWDLLNPSAQLAEKVENKVTQVKWLGDLAKEYLPESMIVPVKETIWKERPLIIQWAHGHTGDSTILVNSAAELSAIQKKFPDRIARISEYIHGPTFTVNVIVNGTDVFVGNINYQITGLAPFTDNRFSTVGNDWGLTHSLLSEEETAKIDDMAKEIGDKMGIDGWKGLFGIDVIRDDTNGRVLLIEINARQPAGSVFESFLQQEFRRHGIAGLTTFEAHLKSVRGESINGPLIHINDGAQIIQRVTKNFKEIEGDVVGSLELAGYTVIEYENDEENADLLRVQSLQGIMETHDKLNTRGKEIEDIIHLHL